MTGGRRGGFGLGRSKIVGTVVAGFPSPAEQYVEPELDLNALLVKRPAATYFVKVEGDSMIGRGIRDRDLLVVDRSLTPEDGDVVIASLDGEFTVKTLRIGFEADAAGRQRKVYSLEPANDAYSVIRVGSGHKLDYFGKVTAVIHRL